MIGENEALMLPDFLCFGASDVNVEQANGKAGQIGNGPGGQPHPFDSFPQLGQT